MFPQSAKLIEKKCFWKHAAHIIFTIKTSWSWLKGTKSGCRVKRCKGLPAAGTAY